MTLGVATTLGILSGSWADEKWGTDPWLAVSGAFLGFAAGIVNLVRVYEFFSSRLGGKSRRSDGQ